MTTQHTPAGFMALLSPERATERIAELKSQRDDLLAALREVYALRSTIMNNSTNGRRYEGTFEHIRAAIAKAEGKT